VGRDQRRTGPAGGGLGDAAADPRLTHPALGLALGGNVLRCSGRNRMDTLLVRHVKTYDPDGPYGQDVQKGVSPPWQCHLMAEPGSCCWRE